MLAEVYSYVRSPYRDLFVYDNVVQVCHFALCHEILLNRTNQYECLPNISPPSEKVHEGSRWMCHFEERISGSPAGDDNPSEQPEIPGKKGLEHPKSGGTDPDTPEMRSIVTPSL